MLISGGLGWQGDHSPYDDRCSSTIRSSTPISTTRARFVCFVKDLFGDNHIQKQTVFCGSPVGLIIVWMSPEILLESIVQSSVIILIQSSSKNSCLNRSAERIPIGNRLRTNPAHTAILNDWISSNWWYRRSEAKITDWWLGIPYVREIVRLPGCLVFGQLLVHQSSSLHMLTYIETDGLMNLIAKVNPGKTSRIA